MPGDLAHTRPKRAVKVVVPTEAVERQTIITFARANAGRHPELRLLLGIHNELPFIRSAVNNRFTFFRYLKVMGFQKGIPDLFLPAARRGFFGLWIEVKRTKRWVLTAEQEWWHAQLRQMGYAVVLSIGAAPGCEALLHYVQGPPTLSLHKPQSFPGNEMKGGQG